MRRNTKRWSCLIVAIASFQYSCQKNISVVPPAYSNKASIQCFIETDSIPILYLNKTVGYFDPAVKRYQLFVRNAMVIISNAAIEDTLSIDSVFDKIDCQYVYFYKGKNKIKPNATYHLNIVSDIGNYTASANTNLQQCQIDSVAYIAKFNDINGEHEGVMVFFKDNVFQSNYYRYSMLRYIDSGTKKSEQPIQSACLGADSVLTNEIGRAVYSNQGLEGQQMRIVVEPSYSHKTGTVGYISIETIDKNAYDFFNQLDQQKIAANNPFVEPVFIKPGQFGDSAIGFFSSKKNSPNYFFTYQE